MVLWCCGIPFWCCGVNGSESDERAQSPGSHRPSSSVYNDRSISTMGRGVSMRSTAASSRFQKIDDEYESLEEVQDALRKAGLESSDMILGIDFTKSNETSGFKSFNGHSLHSTETETNPYMTAISIICRTLQAFDDDQIIPVYGFGEIMSRDRDLISFAPGDQPLRAFESIFKAYRYLQEAVWKKPSEPLSRQLTTPSLSSWMEMFDDGLEEREFDNFQFVNFTDLAEQASRQRFSTTQWETTFAMRALMEVPHQYTHIASTGVLGMIPSRPPPIHVHVHDPPVATPSAPGAPRSLSHV